jgi:hypothetical protein
MLAAWRRWRAAIGYLVMWSVWLVRSMGGVLPAWCTWSALWPLAGAGLAPPWPRSMRWPGWPVRVSSRLTGDVATAVRSGLAACLAL